MIESKVIEVSVEKESYELGEFVGGLLVKTAECKFNDGEITAAEYAEIGMQAVMSATNAIEGITKIADAEGIEYVDVAMGITLPVIDSTKKILQLKKDFDAKAE